MVNDSIHLPLKTKFILIGLLLILNIILRIPAVLHEIGWDSFAVHLMANSINTFGCAKWWIHPASVFGSYPYSTSPSAVPFLLSGISQSTGLDTEITIFFYSIVLGGFSVFAAYLMAGSIWNNDIYKFLVAFVFSTLQGIVTFSTWTANARTLLVLSLPIFIYLLLKSRTYKLRFGVLSFFIFMLFFTTHHMFYYTIPVIMSLFILIWIYKSKYISKIYTSIKVPENYLNVLIFAGFLVMILIPFFNRTLMDMDPGGGVGGRYNWMQLMIITYSRYIGVLIVIAIGGYSYLLFKKNKKFEEWFLLLCLLGLTPFLYTMTYMKWFILTFVSLLIGRGLTNITRIFVHTKNKKYATFFGILLILSISFTGYYQFLHFLNDPSPNKRYMEEQTYEGGRWIKNNINKNMVGDPFIISRIAAVSEVPTLTGLGGSDLAYGLADMKKVNITRIYSPLSYEFYFKDPYKITNRIDHNYYRNVLLRTDINNPESYANQVVSMFNLSYFAENMDDNVNEFSKSVHKTKNNLYNNGKIRIWNIDG